jgi:catechol 2,3-dioxygenase-like lactoylglutathione lyase family enzyme
VARVTGIGGVFFRSQDPEGLSRWYEEHLSFPDSIEGSTIFRWREVDPEREAITVWGAFNSDTDYFGPSGQQWMLNYRVDDLDGVLEQLREAGVEIDDVKGTEEYEFGRFAWIVDPDGNRVELWEPADGW